MTHTSGPWKVHTCGGCGGYEIHAEVSVENLRSSDDSSMDEHSVLQAHFVSSSFDGAVKRLDDARLIAAAPSLLKACKWINEFISTAKDGGDAWIAVRDQPGAKEWAEGLRAAVSEAEASG